MQFQYKLNFIFNLVLSVKIQRNHIIQIQNFNIKAIQIQEMFKKTIQTSKGTPVNFQTTKQDYNKPHGYNTERAYERFSSGQQRYASNLRQQNPSSHRKTLTSGQFNKLKKNDERNNNCELVIRQCQVDDYIQCASNNSSTPRQKEDIENVNQHFRSSNKKTRSTIGSRTNMDSRYNQALDELNMSDHQNLPKHIYNHKAQTSEMFELKKQLQNLQNYVIHSNNEQMKSIQKQTKLCRSQYQSALQNFSQQTNYQFNIQVNQIKDLSKKQIQTQKLIRIQQESLNEYIRDNEIKMQNLVLQMCGNSRKSKNNDQFGVDLKSSSQCIVGGMGTSMSVNFQSEQNNFNMTMKLYNELSLQIEGFKTEIQSCNQKIDALKKQVNNKSLAVIQSQKSTSVKPQQNTNSQIQITENIEKLIKQSIGKQLIKSDLSNKIKQLTSKNIQITEKSTKLETNVKELYKLCQDIDKNIKGMNDEFKRVINNNVLKKEKLLESRVNNIDQKIAEIMTKVNNQTTNNNNEQIVKQIAKAMEKLSKEKKIIKVRSQSNSQKDKFKVLQQHSDIYMLDQNGYLLDSKGSYLLEETSHSDSGQIKKSRIKVDSQLQYLLESLGVKLQTAVQ